MCLARALELSAGLMPGAEAEGRLRMPRKQGLLQLCPPLPGPEALRPTKGLKNWPCKNRRIQQGRGRSVAHGGSLPVALWGRHHRAQGREMALGCARTGAALGLSPLTCLAPPLFPDIWPPESGSGSQGQQVLSWHFLSPGCFLLPGGLRDKLVGDVRSFVPQAGTTRAGLVTPRASGHCSGTLAMPSGPSLYLAVSWGCSCVVAPL